MLQFYNKFLAPRDLHRRATYCIRESSFLIHFHIGSYHKKRILFFLNDSLTSYRLTTQTKCCEPLQELGARLGASKTSLIPPVILYSFQGDTSVVVLTVLCFGVEFLCCLHIKCFIYFSKVLETELSPIGEIAANSAYNTFSYYKCLIVI